MSVATSTLARPELRRPAVPSAILGTLVFVISESMYFLALISAFFVIKERTVGSWAPPGDLRLPVLATAFNTVVLLISGVLLVLAARSYAVPETRGRTKALYVQALAMGAFFVAFQGYEWVKLIGYGMTMTSGTFGATFYLIIGSHGLHALGAVLWMAVLYRRLQQDKLRVDTLRAMTLFWLFVVGIWPILYGLVYFD